MKSHDKTRVLFGNGEKKFTVDDKWSEHPAYKGVNLKKIVTSETSEDTMSLLLVKIQPGKKLDLHIHEHSAELHEILEGSGLAFIGDKNIEYKVGVSSFISKGVIHSVKAGESGLLLRATFSPAL